MIPTAEFHCSDLHHVTMYAGWHLSTFRLGFKINIIYFIHVFCLTFVSIGWKSVINACKTSTNQSSRSDSGQIYVTKEKFGARGVIGWWGCAAGLGGIFTTELIIMRSNNFHIKFLHLGILNKILEFILHQDDWPTRLYKVRCRCIKRKWQCIITFSQKWLRWSL